MTRPPPLFRVSRLLGRIGIVVAVVILSYVGLTVYSASQIGVGSGGSPTTVNVSQNVVTLTSGFSLANHGVLAITGVSITSVVRYPDGTLLGVASSPTLTIPPATNSTIPVSISVPLSAGAEAAALLTHSVHLPAETSANVTFGGIVTVRVLDSSGFDWGAPFDSLNATVGSPMAQPNGTVAVPVQISFNNRAQFDENGQFNYAILSSTGATCASGMIPVQVPPGGAFNQGVTVYLPASCSASGGAVALSYTGAGLNLALPKEPIP